MHQKAATESRLSKLSYNLKNFWINCFYASDPAYVLQKRHSSVSTAMNKSQVHQCYYCTFTYALPIDISWRLNFSPSWYTFHSQN